MNNDEPPLSAGGEAASGRITVAPGKIRGTCTPPGSKSYAQRALAASLLAPGVSVLHNIECCDDTLSAIGCIETLGAAVRFCDDRTLAITGGLNPVGDRLRVGESGLSARLFTPIASLCDRALTIEGAGTLLHRPMLPMIETLRALGVRVRDGGGYLPIEVRGPLHGGDARIDGSLSSQFITGLLLALPLAARETTLRVTDPVSTPYIDMTIDTAARFGIEILHNDYEEFYIAGGQRYRPAEMTIESDWSAAAFLLVAGATAGEVRVEGLSNLSKQADMAVLDALVRAGASVVHDGDTTIVSSRPLQAFEFDATHCPDLFPALTALAVCCEGTSRIRGTSRLVGKESNRAETLCEEYGRLGIELSDEDDVLTVSGGVLRGGSVKSHGDHRIVMSLAVAALRADGSVTIEGAECVAKSFPRFFEQLHELLGR